tara:strand:+ start:197 stop:1312 length:1116 start_codon:yes stop_codon:yes gene_type:complete
MKVKELNLKEINISIDEDSDIPEEYSADLIRDFNARNFNNDNINIIIRFCCFLKIKKSRKFVVHNIEPSHSKLTKLKEKYYKVFPDFMIPSTNEFDYINFDKLVLEVTKLGLVKWIEYCYNFNFGWNHYISTSYNTKDRLYNVAIEYNQLKALKFILSLYKGKQKTYNNRFNKYPWDFYSVRIAIESKYTDLNLLKWMIDNGVNYSNNKIYDILIDANKLDFFEYFLKKKEFNFYRNHLEQLIKKGNLDFFKCIEENNPTLIPWDICFLTVKLGTIELLKYLVSKNWYINNDSAAKILYEKDLNFEDEYLNPLKLNLIQLAINLDKVDFVKYFHSDLKFDIKNMDLKHPRYFNNACVKYLRENNFKIEITW